MSPSFAPDGDILVFVISLMRGARGVLNTEVHEVVLEEEAITTVVRGGALPVTVSTHTVRYYYSSVQQILQWSSIQRSTAV